MTYIRKKLKPQISFEKKFFFTKILNIFKTTQNIYPKKLEGIWQIKTYLSAKFHNNNLIFVEIITKKQRNHNFSL